MVVRGSDGGGVSDGVGFGRYWCWRFSLLLVMVVVVMVVGVEVGCVCGRCTHTMHSRSRTTIDPRIPTTPGRSPWGFHRPGRHR